MKTKEEIVKNWLTRYTGTALKDFGKYILLTNFQNYVDMFAEINGAEINGLDKAMPNTTSGDITLINFSMLVVSFPAIFISFKPFNLNDLSIDLTRSSI